MKIYRVQRSGKSCGEWNEWLVDGVFSTDEKANQYIKDHPMDRYTYQHVIEQELI